MSQTIVPVLLGADLNCYNIARAFHMKYWIYVTARTSKGSTATFCQGVTLNMGYAIMGSSGTTLTQMINYYNSKAIYPTFYMYSDAPTIMSL